MPDITQLPVLANVLKVTTDEDFVRLRVEAEFNTILNKLHKFAK